MKPLIYALYDPRDNRCYYVGYTKNLAARMHYHFRDRKHSTTKKLQCLAQPWLFELADLGLMPVSKPLEWLTLDVDWEEREKFWIEQFRSSGEPLLNGTVGGYGSKGRHWSPNEQQRRAISVRNKQAWVNRSPEQRQAALDVLEKGRKYHRRPELDGPRTEEHKKAISEGLKKSYAEGRRKREWSEEAKRNASEGMRRYWATRPDSEKQAAVKKMHESRWKK